MNVVKDQGGKEKVKEFFNYVDVLNIKSAIFLYMSHIVKPISSC